MKSFKSSNSAMLFNYKIWDYLASYNLRFPPPFTCCKFHRNYQRILWRSSLLVAPLDKAKLDVAML